MSNTIDPFATAPMVHSVGRYAGESLYRVFSSLVLPDDGGEAILNDCGPFLTRDEAQALVDLATRAGVEDIPPGMVNRARSIHLAAMRRGGRP